MTPTPDDETGHPVSLVGGPANGTVTWVHDPWPRFGYFSAEHDGVDYKYDLRSGPTMIGDIEVWEADWVPPGTAEEDSSDTTTETEPGQPGPQGERGPIGPSGGAGPPGDDMEYRGIWDDGTTYEPMQVVRHGTSTWSCLVTNAFVEPGTDDDTWGLLNIDGTVGPPGPEGDPGPKGDKGDKGDPGTGGGGGGGFADYVTAALAIEDCFVLLPFNEGAGYTDAENVADNAVPDGVLNGGVGFVDDTTMPEGLGDRCASFDGTNDYISILALDYPSPTVTFAFWANIPSGQGGDKIVAQLGNVDAGERSFMVDLGPTDIWYLYMKGDSATNTNPSYPGVRFLDGWHHYAIVFRKETYGCVIETWIDGWKAAEALPGANGMTALGVKDLTIMARPSAALPCRGKMSHFGMWTRALRASEIEFLATSISGGVEGPAGPEGPEGPEGPAGPAGGAGNIVLHTQASPAATWTVTHNLGFYPGGLSVADNAGTEMLGEIVHTSVDALQVRFSVALSGKVFAS